jgi:hypothetical protein
VGFSVRGRARAVWGTRPVGSHPRFGSWFASRHIIPSPPPLEWFMKHFSARALAACLLAAGLATAGCVKSVPLQGDFEATQKVLLTFKDGRTLEGMIAPGERVEYREAGAIYRAQVASVAEDSIRIRNLVLQDREGSYGVVASRMADARVRIAPPLASKTLSRAEIEKVELIQVDAVRTLRKAAFWTYGGALLALLLGERS